jgi:hypothetical protein
VTLNRKHLDWLKAPLVQLSGISYINCCFHGGLYYASAHVRLIPCHQVMVRPQVAEEGDGPQIWRAAANMLNKQSWIAEKGSHSGLGVGRGANNSLP